MIYSPTAGNEYNDATLEFEVDIQLTAWQFNYAESQGGSYSSQTSLSSSSSQVPYSSATTTSEEIVTVTFEVNGGSSIEPIILFKGSTINEPTEPLKNGYHFDGWFEDLNLLFEYDFSTILNDDLTLFAKWIIVRGEARFDTSGTFYWTAPLGVNSVSVVAIGGGGGGGYINSSGTLAGGGGGLGWKNNITVIPGESDLVIVGAGGVNTGHGGASYFISLELVAGLGGLGYVGNKAIGGAPYGADGGGFVGDGGGNGGKGGSGAPAHTPSGGGAGGYTGNGGNAGSAADPDSGGAGGGNDIIYGRYGGGTGLFGKGETGGVNQNGSVFPGSGAFGQGGYRSNSGDNRQISGGNGAVRIIWGIERNFPSNDVGYSY
jgi:uncharacterized repeat protein (TIGR02543 family)